ncbi:MAG: MBOAT family O-acyltransferase [Desulfobacterales bacterium]
MVFNSIIFIIFFALVLFVYYLPLSWKIKKTHLWIASYLFYAAWNPPFVVLLWISTLVDWFVGKAIANTRKLVKKRILLVLSLSTNLGLLGYFKYGEFLLTSFIAVLQTFDIQFQPAAPDVVLPVGISFYTFQSLSYTLDIYREKLKPWKSFSDFALFVTFFPQLVAGPIVRAAEFLPQLSKERLASARQFGWGLYLLLVGMFEKIVLADTLMAPIADKVYSQANEAGFADAWTGTLAFSGQIFFDFSGYSSCAIGAALCMGFVLPDNFRFPYASIGFTEFWRRWHISLSTWLKDYLYISLGGNRKGQGRTLVNLMLTMLLGGLWHGASWRFIFWGGLHGIYLVSERGLRSVFKNVEIFQQTGMRIGLMLITYLCLCVTWVFFRATDFSSAFTLVSAMAYPGVSGLLDQSEMLTVLFISTALLFVHWKLRDIGMERYMENMQWWVRGILMAFFLISIALVPTDERAFIYFQF